MSDVYRVAGAGDAGANGDYLEDGVNTLGFPLFRLSADYWMECKSYFGNNTYIIYKKVGSESRSIYRRYPSSTDTPDVGTWLTTDSGTSPAPTVTKVSGGGAEPANGNMLVMF